MLLVILSVFDNFSILLLLKRKGRQRYG